MKKTLVALAVAAVAATSANAAVVYNQDGTKVEVGGQFRVLMTKYTGEHADLKNPGSRVIIRGTQDLGDGYSALANLEVRFDKNDTDSFSDIEAKRVYAGFAKEGVGTLTFGKQLTNLDDVAVSDYTYDLGGVKQTKNSANKVAKFRSADFAGFSFGLDYIFADDSNKNTNEDNLGRGFGVSAFYTTPEFAADTKLNFEAGFSQVKITDDVNENAFTVATELVSGPFALGVDYSQKKRSDNANGITDDDYSAKDVTAVLGGFNKVRELEVGAKYNYLDNASIYGEYINGKATKANGNTYVKRNTFILGTDYWFTKSVVAYLEGGTTKLKDQADNKATDNKIGVGFRVYF